MSSDLKSWQGAQARKTSSQAARAERDVGRLDILDFYDAS